jgi:hypothetical protein
MDRADLVSELIDAFGFGKYLEVGVSSGTTFFSVRCKRKIAVDPFFQFDLADARIHEPNATFYQVTSDEFFALCSDDEAPFDIIFLDGLHTAEQILRDFLNAVRFLMPGGVIIIDDVRPSSYVSSLPDLSQSVALRSRLNIEDPSWMGDVYKIVPFIATFCQQFSFASPLEIPNSLVIWASARKATAVPHMLIKEIAEFTFERTVLEPELYNAMEFADISRLISAARD